MYVNGGDIIVVIITIFLDKINKPVIFQQAKNNNLHQLVYLLYGYNKQSRRLSCCLPTHLQSYAWE